MRRRLGDKGLIIPAKLLGGSNNGTETRSGCSRSESGTFLPHQRKQRQPINVPASRCRASTKTFTSGASCDHSGRSHSISAAIRQHRPAAGMAEPMDRRCHAGWPAGFLSRACPQGAGRPGRTVGRVDVEAARDHGRDGTWPDQAAGVVEASNGRCRAYQSAACRMSARTALPAASGSRAARAAMRSRWWTAP